MAEKKRGLGRGLGALIPTVAEGGRPVDVFFPDQNQGAQGTPRKSLMSDSARELLTSTPRIRASVEAEEPAALFDAPVSSSAKSAKTAASAKSDAAKAPAAANGSKPASVKASAPKRAQASAPAANVSRETSTADALGVDANIELVPVPGAHFAELPVALIRPNPKQPRTVFDEEELHELVESIREIGVLQPIVVRPASEGFELIMGERRWRATQLAGLDAIPAIIRITEDEDLLRDALLENLHRSALNPLEEAAAYRQLLDDFGCTHEELATRIARSRPQISNTLRLLNLPPLVQRRVAAGVLSAGHARALLGLNDSNEIERLAQKIVSEGMSVRATEEAVALGSDKPSVKKSREAKAERNVAADDLALRLSDRFDTRVKVDLGKSKGRLTVEFATVEDLNRILAMMVPEETGLANS